MRTRRARKSFEQWSELIEQFDCSNDSMERFCQHQDLAVAYSGEGDRHFRGNVTDIFNLPHWVLKRNVSGHDQSTFFSFLLSAAFDTSSHRITDQLKAVRPV